MKDHQEVTKERDSMKEDIEGLKNRKNETKGKHEALKNDHQLFTTKGKSLQEQLSQIKGEQDERGKECKILKSIVEGIK